MKLAIGWVLWLVMLWAAVTYGQDGGTEATKYVLCAPDSCTCWRARESAPYACQCDRCAPYEMKTPAPDAGQ